MYAILQLRTESSSAKHTNLTSFHLAPNLSQAYMRAGSEVGVSPGCDGVSVVFTDHGRV